MARLITSGFELNDTTGSITLPGIPDPGVPTGASTSITTTNPRSGTYHGRHTVAGGNYFSITLTQTTAVTYWFRAAFYLGSLPAGSPPTDSWTLIDLRTSSASIGTVRVSSTGALTFGSSGATTGVVGTGVYFVLELKHKIDTADAANNLAEILLNGDSIFTATGVGAGLGTTIGNVWRFGLPSVSGTPGNGTVDVDDYAVNNDSGGNQNGTTGQGKIVLLKPISDNARGTGWTGGAGGTSNLFDAVNNLPPAGAADTGTDASQIRNATSNANVNFDANLTSYTSAGIGASDTVNVVVPCVATAAPVVTSAKQGTIGVSSNPAITNIALAAGGTSGAFWSGTTGGTYPSGWKWSPGTVTYAPAVTVDSSPVARITQVTSSTRIAMVCAMGMYVDYTPHGSLIWPMQTLTSHKM